MCDSRLISLCNDRKPFNLDTAITEAVDGVLYRPIPAINCGFQIFADHVSSLVGHGAL
jgi:hypothetical protein